MSQTTALLSAPIGSDRKPPQRAPRPDIVPRLLSLRDAAQALGISEKSVQRLAKVGQIRLVRLGHRVLCPRSEMERLAEAGTTPTEE